MTEQWIPQSKNELMSAIRREWAMLMEVAAGLTEKQMLSADAGGWSPKDNLAHLSEWMKILMGHHMDRRPAHEVMDLPEEITRGWDMEVINPELFERNKDRTTDEVLSELRTVYDLLMAKLETMSFEDLLAPQGPTGPVVFSGREYDRGELFSAVDAVSGKPVGR